MILHNNKKDFTDAIATAAIKFGIREVYIEKDYWVTYVLKNLSQSKFSDSVVFKGGTSLSKAYNLIERFSEDVDLALLLTGDETGGQIKKLIKTIESTLMANPFIVNDNHVVTSKGSNFRKTAHQYPRMIKSSNFGNVYDHLVLEINSFANPTPYKKMVIGSILAEFLQSVDESLINEYEMYKIEVNVLDIRRTFAEKIMGLVRAGYDKNSINVLIEKIRHIYDLHKLLYTEDIKLMLSDDSFPLMIEAVRNDDRKNSQFQGAWMEKKLSESLLFKEPKKTMKELKIYYNNIFSTLVYGDLQNIEDMISSIERISKELHKIEI